MTDNTHRSYEGDDIVPHVCRACESRHGGICSVLTHEQLVQLNKHSSRRTIEGGAEVVGQGESVGSYSNILRGVVKLSKMMADGRQQIVGLQFAPDFLGRPFSRESSLTAEAATAWNERCERGTRRNGARSGVSSSR